MLWLFISAWAWAQEPDSDEVVENTLESGFVVQGEIQRPDLTILMAKDDVTRAYELELVEDFLPKILESLKHAPL